MAGGEGVLLHHILAQRGGDHPDQPMLDLRRQLGLRHDGFLETIETAAPRDQQRHRLACYRPVGIANQIEHEVAIAPAGIGLVEAVLLDPANEYRAEIRVAQHIGALEKRLGDRYMGGGKRRIEPLMVRKAIGERGP